VIKNSPFSTVKIPQFPILEKSLRTADNTERTADNVENGRMVIDTR